MAALSEQVDNIPWPDTELNTQVGADGEMQSPVDVMGTVQDCFLSKIALATNVLMLKKLMLLTLKLFMIFYHISCFQKGATLY